MRNLSRFIPGEEIDAVSQWNFAAVDTQALRLAEQVRADKEAADVERDASRDETVRRQAYAEGFAQGQASTRLQADKQVREYIENQGQQAARRLGQLLESARDQLEQSQQIMARGVLDLACELAQQVLRHELSVNPNALQPVVREGLRLLSDECKSAVLRLNPVDLDVLKDTLDAEFTGLALTWTADGAIQQGGCLISCAGAVVDGTLSTRWRRTVAKLGLEVQWDD